MLGSRPGRTPHRLLAAVLLGLLCIVGVASVAGGASSPSWFELAVSDRLSSHPTTVVVAGRPASLIATAYVDFAAPGCQVKDFDPQTPLTATVQLPTGVSLVAGQAAAKQVHVPANIFTGKADTFNLAWRIVVARRGVYVSRVGLSGVARTGTTCTADERASIVGVRGTPEIQVLGAFDAGDRDVAVVSTRLPGLPAVGPETRKEALSDAINDFHAPIDAEDQGKIAANLLTLRWGGQSHQWVGSSGETVVGGAAITCVYFERVPETSTRSVPYHLLFNWNVYKGFAVRSRHGTLRIGARVPGAAGRTCVHQLENGGR